jgi:Fic family protein
MGIITGATTTRRVAKEMIRVGRAPRDRSERMILNNFLTMQRISTLKNEPLTKDLVFEIHRMLTDQALNDPSSAGRFRRVDESIVVGDEYGEVFHQPPPADQLEERLAAMCTFANGSTPREFVHPAIRSILLHFWLAYDHPFVDGNGRTARALFYWSMLRHGFWLFEFISISRIILRGPARYGRAFLYTETDQNDLTYFIIYHLDVIRRAVDELHEYIQRKTSQLQALEQQLRGLESLNHRQRALVSHALRHPQQRYTYGSHRRSHNIAYQTARNDLLSLMRLDL